MRILFSAVVSGAIAVTACTDGTQAPLVTALEITTRTSGLDLASDYTISVDQATPTRIGVNATIIIRDLALGAHTVDIAGIADNCSVDGSNSQVVSLSPASVVAVDFDLTCVAVWGKAEISVAATGLDGPATYTVETDDGTSVIVAANGVATLHLAGERAFTLRGVSSNCAVDGGDTRTALVPSGTIERGTVQIRFDVACTATSGIIEVATATSGDDFDFDGYVIEVDGAQPMSVASNGISSRGGILGGEHVVTLIGVAANCTVADGNSRTASVTTGGFSRDVARVSFALTCSRVDKIAFTRWIEDSYYGSLPQLMVAEADGSNQVIIADGANPSWSPDGASLVVWVGACDYWYGCYASGLAAIRADSGSVVMLTSQLDTDPSWSPDGSKVVFRRESQIPRNRLQLMNADGSSQTPLLLPDSVRDAAEPTWSPDGRRVAFACQVVLAGWRDICVVNTDGTGFMMLTRDPWSDARPAWSPDGARIAFTTNRDDPLGQSYIALMSQDGTGSTRVAAGRAASWSRDGSRIVFVASGSEPGLYVVNVDGTGLTRITNHPSDDAPAWRP